LGANSIQTARTNFMSDQIESKRGQHTLLIVLTLALLLWGAYHAVGSYFGGFGKENLPHNLGRSLMVFGCMAAFLGFWWFLMLTRKPRNRRTDGRFDAKNE
jgi:hypothetical protein